MPTARPDATKVLSRFDGVWIGMAEAVTPDGMTHRFEQMERVGPMLNGEIRIMEGKARDSRGRTLHNAFTVFSAVAADIEMRSWTPGHAGARRITLTNDGFDWETPTGTTSKMVYQISIVGDEWREVGTLHVKGQAPSISFKMTLKRVSQTDWPRSNASFPSQP